MKKDFAVAVKAVIIKDTQILLLKRSDREMRKSRFDQKTIWDLPGGGLRFKERIEDGLIREIQEETGLKVKILKPLSIDDVLHREIHLLIATYLCAYKSGEVRLSKEHMGYEWLPMAQLSGWALPEWLYNHFLKAISEWEHIMKNSR